MQPQGDNSRLDTTFRGTSGIGPSCRIAAGLLGLGVHPSRDHQLCFFRKGPGKIEFFLEEPDDDDEAGEVAELPFYINSPEGLSDFVTTWATSSAAAKPGTPEPDIDGECRPDSLRFVVARDGDSADLVVTREWTILHK